MKTDERLGVDLLPEHGPVAHRRLPSWPQRQRERPGRPPAGFDPVSCPQAERGKPRAAEPDQPVKTRVLADVPRHLPIPKRDRRGPELLLPAQQPIERQNRVARASPAKEDFLGSRRPEGPDRKPRKQQISRGLHIGHDDRREWPARIDGVNNAQPRQAQHGH